MRQPFLYGALDFFSGGQRDALTVPEEGAAVHGGGNGQLCFRHMHMHIPRADGNGALDLTKAAQLRRYFKGRIAGSGGIHTQIITAEEIHRRCAPGVQRDLAKGMPYMA